MINDVKENNLDIGYFYRNEKDKLLKRRAYIVVCRCGNEKLMFAPGAVRCQSCGRGHDYGTLLKYKQKAEKLAKFSDGRRGRIKQWRPVPQQGVAMVDLKTGKTRSIPKEYLDIIKKKIPKTFICPKCKKSIAWTMTHFLSGVSIPLITIDSEEMCYPCARKKFHSD